MVQYRATDGLVNDYHIVHLGKFALGKFGIVFTENCAIEPRGRVTQGDLGMWDDSQIEGHKRLTRFLQQEGSLAATQITHAGRKASSPRQFDKPDEFGPEGRRLAALAGGRPVGAVCRGALLGVAARARSPGDGSDREEVRRGCAPRRRRRATTSSRSTAPMAICWRSSSRRSATSATTRMAATAPAA